MIFVSVGTHPQQFNRLLIEIDKLISDGKLKEKVVAQSGVSDYKPKNFKCKSFFDFSELEKNIKKSSSIITHAGAGTIITAINARKKIIVVPRLKKFSEHTNDHQLELAHALEAEGKIIAVYDIEKLGNAILAARKFEPKSAKESLLAKKLYAYLKSVKVRI